MRVCPWRRSFAPNASKRRNRETTTSLGGGGFFVFWEVLGRGHLEGREIDFGELFFLFSWFLLFDYKCKKNV